jgi:hypothetical protein
MIDSHDRSPGNAMKKEKPAQWSLSRDVRLSKKLVEKTQEPEHATILLEYTTFLASGYQAQCVPERLIRLAPTFDPSGI